MIPDARVYSMMVKNNRVVPMIESIGQIIDALFDYNHRGIHMIEVTEQTIIEQNSIMI